MEPKSWCNREIREAIAEQKASRNHRQAEKAQLPQDEVARKWEIYRKKKPMVHILVQAKIKGESERLLSEIREKKAAPRIFWNHINLLGRIS